MTLNVERQRKPLLTLRNAGVERLISSLPDGVTPSPDLRGWAAAALRAASAHQIAAAQARANERALARKGGSNGL